MQSTNLLDSRVRAPLGVFKLGCRAFLLLASAVSVAQTPAFELTETREPCSDYDTLKQPHFGDTHVHTSFSFDSYISQQRNDPWDAYRYAKGEQITLPDGNGNDVIKARIGSQWRAHQKILDVQPARC